MNTVTDFTHFFDNDKKYTHIKPKTKRNKYNSKMVVSQIENSLMHLHHHEYYNHLSENEVKQHTKIVDNATKDLQIDKAKTQNSHKELLKKMFGSKAVNTTLDVFQQYGNIKKNRKKMTDYLDKRPKTVDEFEDLQDHRMAAFSSASYEYYKGMKNNGDPAKGTEKVNEFFDEYSHYITDLKDYEVDERLSTVDNLVLHNKTTGQTHIAYRGTQPEGSPVLPGSDWATNYQSANPFIDERKTSPLVKQAIKTAEKVRDVYGLENTTVSGHSLGGQLSLAVTQHFAKDNIHIPGWHFDPGSSLNQMIRQHYIKGEQTVLRTHFDLPSLVPNMTQLGFKPKSLKIKNILTHSDVDMSIPGIDTHSMSHFLTKNPSITADGQVQVVRNSPESVLSTALKSGDRTLKLIADHPTYGKAVAGGVKVLKYAEKAALPIAVVGTGIEAGIDLSDKNKTKTEKAADVTYDVASNAGLFALGYYAGGMSSAFVLSSAICPECTMMAAVAGLTVGVGLPIAVDATFQHMHLKNELEREMGAVEDFTDKAVDKTVDATYATGDAIKDATYATGDEIKHIGNALNPTHWF